VLSLPPAVQLWYCPQPVDMRLGFDGLFALVRTRLLAAFKAPNFRRRQGPGPKGLAPSVPIFRHPRRHPPQNP
jgi:hypothetical protein